MSSLMGKFKSSIEVSNLADGDSIASYLVDASGNLLTSSLVGAKQALDALSQSEHLDGSAYAAGVDYLGSMGVVDDNGNWVPITLNAAGEIPVSASVDFAGDYPEDSPHVSGDIGLFNLAVRRDVRSAGSDTDGDYSSFNVNAVGELWVKDEDNHTELVAVNSELDSITAQLVLANSSLDAIEADVDEINTSVNNIEADVDSINSILLALSKAEDSVHVSGDQGIQALAVRKDTSGSNAANGDYTSLLTWSEGSLKVVDIANAAILQQQISVANAATLLPATPLANRRSLMLQNAGSASVWVGSATVTSSGATAGIEMPKASFMELEVGPGFSVYGITGGANQNVNVLELS